MNRDLTTKTPWVMLSHNQDVICYTRIGSLQWHKMVCQSKIKRVKVEISTRKAPDQWKERKCLVTKRYVQDYNDKHEWIKETKTKIQVEPKVREIEWWKRKETMTFRLWGLWKESRQKLGTLLKLSRILVRNTLWQSYGWPPHMMVIVW